MSISCSLLFRLALASLLPLAALAQNAAPSPTAATAPEHCDLQGYRTHLVQLESLVAQCAQQINARNCDPTRVGPDNEVATGTETRKVRYAWLRNVLQAAAASAQNQNHDQAQGQNKLLLARAKLADSSRRLEADLALTPENGRPGENGAGLGSSRERLAHILSSSEFAHTQQSSLLAQVRDAFFEWLEGRLLSIAAYGSKSVWLARIFVAAAVFIAASLLVFWLKRQASRQHAAASAKQRLAEDDSLPSREWGLLEAQRLAQEKRWREAIRCLYWAAIFRLETKSLWSADEARTPREYLALVAAGSGKRPDLTALTRNFERTWYGGAPAGEAEFNRARALFERLVA
ncbi:MAG TPA: DUF4129 domain-containing protein [Acidobacteriaceae bacterium]|jgi:hypothetical protein|nr:DUF4129 domain-containing protein [Acidobacteriaceae bacterium]